MEKNISFRIKGIEIVNTAINAPAEGGIVTTFAFDMQFRAATDPQKNIITVFSDVLIREEERNLQVGRFSSLFHYEVEELEKLIKAKDLNQVEVPKDLISTLLGISASTLRGLMFGAFKGTFLHNAILPAVDIGAIQPSLVPLPN